MEIEAHDELGFKDNSYNDSQSISPPLNGDSTPSFLSNFIEKSSVYAASQIGQAKTKPCRVFWLMVLLICLCGCIYEANSFLTVFFEYPVLTDLEVKNGGNLEFPAVTVCNLNRIKKEKEKCVYEDKPWFECFQPRIAIVSLNQPVIFSERKIHTSTSNVTTKRDKKYKLKSQEFLNHYTSLDTDSQYCYGYKLNELVRQCSFNSNPCYASNFSSFQSIQYGNCFTINRKTLERKNIFKVKKVGPDTGLELVLNVMLNSYLSITPSAGVRVIIHNPNENPKPVEEGFNISPGYETQVSLTKTSVKRLPAPYRDRCVEYKVTDNDDRTSGSQYSCVQECMQQTSQVLCGCVDPFLVASRNMTLCNLKNKTQMACLDEILDGLTKGGLTCECPLPCLSTTYNLKISTTLLKYIDVNANSFKSFEDTLCNRSKMKTNLNENQNHLSQILFRKRRSYKNTEIGSMVKLKIFYGSLDHTLYVQKATYSDSEFFAHLGGNFSLWLGLSLVALFEYAEFIIFLPHIFVQKRKTSTK
ncbi:FMRFamide-activated amiloride-sensitive sodium channel [Trichonephila clavipes]|nr:FMRFamide-activated amiloride-sensitive sodium channel [Trichonephila clavipes]